VSLILVEDEHKYAVTVIVNVISTVIFGYEVRAMCSFYVEVVLVVELGAAVIVTRWIWPAVLKHTNLPTTRKSQSPLYRISMREMESKFLMKVLQLHICSSCFLDLLKQNPSRRVLHVSKELRGRDPFLFRVVNNKVPHAPDPMRQ
jgi:hypothetical protein